MIWTEVYGRFTGAVMTLSSMMIRVGHAESFGWNQCFGTCEFRKNSILLLFM